MPAPRATISTSRHNIAKVLTKSAAAPGAGLALLLARDGTLKRYSYPDFRPRGGYRLGLAAYRLALNAAGCRVYVAGFDPQAVAADPHARAHGDVHVYELEKR